MKIRKLQLFFLRYFSWFLVIALFLILGLVKIEFLRAKTILYMFHISSLTGFLIYGQALCLISGNFDLSIDRIAGISVLMGGLILTRWLPDTPGILAVIFVIIFGALLGAVNGFIVGKVRVNSFLVTLSTYLIYLYLAYYLLAAPIGSNQLPSSFFWLGKAKMFGINVSFILFVILGLILNFILRRTSFGVSVYATGVDNSISNALGINTGNVIFYIYTIAGAIAGIAGLAYVGFVGSVTNSIATGEVFWTFAGAILGGVSLSGGRGSIINVIGGSLFIGLVTTGVLVFNIVATLRMVVAGVIILISILLSKAIENWEQKIILSNND